MPQTLGKNVCWLISGLICINASEHFEDVQSCTTQCDNHTTRVYDWFPSEVVLFLLHLTAGSCWTIDGHSKCQNNASPVQCGVGMSTCDVRIQCWHHVPNFNFIHCCLHCGYWMQMTSSLTLSTCFWRSCIEGTAWARLFSENSASTPLNFTSRCASQHPWHENCSRCHLTKCLQAHQPYSFSKCNSRYWFCLSWSTPASVLRLKKTSGVYVLQAWSLTLPYMTCFECWNMLFPTSVWSFLFLNVSLALENALCLVTTQHTR